jgi:membrane protein DedA with SNARE-associated domain
MVMPSEPSALHLEGAPVGFDPGLSREDRTIVRGALTLLGVLSAGSMLGVAFFAYLVEHNPLLLIGMSPLSRHQMLVAPIVDPFSFVAVATCRSLLFCSSCYVLGRTLGPSGILWLEARAEKAARFVRWLERAFNKAPHPVLFLMIGPVTSAIAGSSRMKPWVYGVVAGTGLMTRSLVILEFADWLREPIEALLALIEQYQLPVTLVLVFGIAIYQIRKRRARKISASSSS